MGLEVMTMKRYWTLPRPELKPHSQMQFSVILRTLPFREDTEGIRSFADKGDTELIIFSKFGSVGLFFCSISTIEGYLMPGPFYTCICFAVGWFFWFYGISTFVGYLTPNPFLCK